MPSLNMLPQGDAAPAAAASLSALSQVVLVRGGEMTPIIGLLVAVVAGFVASSRREVLIGVIPPMLAATAAQSWYLGSGRGHNAPATTTDDPEYWIVQLIIVALVGGVAIGIYAVRARRVSRRGGGLVPVRRGPGSWMVAAATVAGFAGTLGLMFATDRPGHPGSGNGNLPVTGVVGIAIAILAIAVLGLLWLRNRPVSSTPDVHEPDVRELAN
jgi:peptidoglycan/LPS O-acetylase OafA/YrhL